MHPVVCVADVSFSFLSPRGEIKKASKQAAVRRNAHEQFCSRGVLSWKRLILRLSVWRFKQSVLLISVTPILP